MKFESLALTKAEIKQLSTDLRNESGYKFAYRPFDDYVYVITNKQSVIKILEKAKFKEVEI